MRMEGTRLAEEFVDCEISPDAVIDAEDIRIGVGSSIGAGVAITARTVRIGAGCRIERGTTVRSLGKPMEEFALGDEALIGHSTQILAPRFEMGDYSQLHNSGLHSGYQPLTLGHNCWVGQDSILNCTERLSIGNNCRIGTQSQLWTHVASGELLEGCTLFGATPLTLEDNVWIVGGAVVSPGLVLGRNSIIMTGAVVTRSTEPFHTYAGIPAKDVTDKLNFWTQPTVAEKLAMIRRFADEFGAAHPQHAGIIRVVEAVEPAELRRQGELLVTWGFDRWEEAPPTGASVFDLATKHYLKRRSPAEIAWMRFITGYRARFLPYVPGENLSGQTAQKSQ